MNTTTALTPAAGAEWFAAWFDSKHYHRLYANRDEREAAELVERVIQRLRPTASGASRALDLGCGAGRHSRKLAALGLDVTGLDLSAASIRDAKASETGHLRFVRGDMRRPFGRRAFDFVFSLFTSFGYFEEPADHLKVVRNIARSLKPGGALVLDYMNARFVQDHLKSQEVVERGGVVYHLSRWADARHIYKKIVIHDPASPMPLEYVERVAKFSLGDFRSMFRSFGITVEDVYGDYALMPFDPEHSPRILMVARKGRGERALLSRPIPANAADGFRRHAEI
jgi:SAM-dependent methyltransferase